MANKNSKQTIPQKVKHFLFREEDEELFNQVEEYNNYANYSLDYSNTSRTILNALKDVPAMVDDPICGSAVKCVMQTAFQTNGDNKLFTLVTPSTLIENELNDFHEAIGVNQFLLTTGYNCLLWGQLPWKHVYSEEGILERLIPIPDFTSITPVIISGKTIGFMNEKDEFVPSYEYTYAQLEYYKNLGGNSANNSMTIGTNSGTEESFRNEFTYANSYLGQANKPWRNVNIIEDGLLLNRMDQSNYYRIISVNVGAQVYSKSAIQVLNYYRNLFKKVRRVNYDSDGMSARGVGQNFEVIVPQTQNQGVDVKEVAGNMDIKALKDLDTQYQKLFAALQIQPSMIGFSEDTPSSLGDSAALTWDKRFAKVCKTVMFAAYDALRNIDYLHLRSLGYNCTRDDWKYATVSGTIQEDADKGESLKLAVENLKEITDSFNSMEMEYDKQYLVKSLLSDALANFGVDSEKLLASQEDVGDENEELMIATSLRKGEISNPFKQNILNEDAQVMALAGIFSKKTAKQIVAAFGKSKIDKINIQEKTSPLTLRQLYSSFVVKKDNPINLDNFVMYVDDTPDTIRESFIKSTHQNSEAMPFKFPVICSKEFTLTAGDLDLGGVSCVDNLYVDENGNYIINNKNDLAKYLYNFMNDGIDCYCGNIWKK